MGERTEFAVYDRSVAAISPPGVATFFETEEEAESWLAELERRREICRAAAASGSPWPNSGEWETADFVVVSRTISPWMTVDPLADFYRAMPRPRGKWAAEYRTATTETWDTAPRMFDTKYDAEGHARETAADLRREEAERAGSEAP